MFHSENIFPRQENLPAYQVVVALYVDIFQMTFSAILKIIVISLSDVQEAIEKGVAVIKPRRFKGMKPITYKVYLMFVTS